MGEVEEFKTLFNGDGDETIKIGEMKTVETDPEPDSKK